MKYRKHKNDLLVDWALLGERGWWIEVEGADGSEIGDRDDTMCHLDRTTLHLIIGGHADWIVERLRDLADAGVPALEVYHSWSIMRQSCGTGNTAQPGFYRLVGVE